MKTLLLIGLFLLSASVAWAFELSSPDFTDKGQLPRSATCDGSGTAPGLAWTGAPQGTKSFALTCVDPDAPAGEFTHWLAYDIPASASALGAGRALPTGSVELPNDYGAPGFGKACPPSGTHRYIFTLYALNVERLNAGVSRAGVLAAINRARIGTAVLAGTYQRKQ